MTNDREERAHVPATILVAAGIVLLEALALIAFAVLDLVDAHSGRLALGFGTALFFLVYATGQGVAAVALIRLAGWARGPLVFTQLVQLGLAWGLRDADPGWLSGVLAAAGVVVLVCLVRPATTKVLYGDDQDPG
ncbi:MAG: hypothetical protein ACRDO8_10335 [Nocardioidaceae bacterium]